MASWRPDAPSEDRALRDDGSAYRSAYRCAVALGRCAGGLKAGPHRAPGHPHGRPRGNAAAVTRNHADRGWSHGGRGRWLLGSRDHADMMRVFACALAKDFC